MRFISKYRVIIVVVVVGLVGLIVWNVAGSLVGWSSSIANDVGGVTANTSVGSSTEGSVSTAELETREFIETPEGKKYLTEGSDTDQAFQSVYDYFNKHLPSINIDSSTYKVYDDGNNNFIVNWGDWVVYVQKSKASGIFFPVQLNKSVAFTVKEKELLQELADGVFAVDGDLYVYKFN